MNKPLILVVEDDAPVRSLIATTLKTHDYKYLSAQNGAGAITEALSHNPDVVLLDLGLPDMDGVDVIRKIRSWSNMPIIVISARTEDSDKIEALDAGADDYLIKPFDLDELSARIRALLRRSAGRSEPTIERGKLLIKPETREVFYNGEPVLLSSKEYALLVALADRAGVVLSRGQLEEKLYDWDSAVGSNTIEVHIHHLRKKLSDSAIKTVRGVGYLLET